MALLSLVLLLSGCGLPDCRAYCAAEADCLAEEVERYDATWRDWTGFADREAFEEACFEVFDESRRSGGERDDLQGVCREELRDPCGG